MRAKKRPYLSTVFLIMLMFLAIQTFIFWILPAPFSDQKTEGMVTVTVEHPPRGVVSVMVRGDQ